MKIPVLLLAASTATLALQAAPTVSNGVATYSSNETIGAYTVPSDWNKIVINSGVTLTGRFVIVDRTTDLIVEGKDKNTSIIQGQARSVDAVDESKAGVRKSGSGKLTVRNLTVKDQPGRGIVGFGGILVVTNCRVIQTANDALTDGIHASADQGTVSNTSINVYDDSTYVTMCNNLTGVSFNHRHNGAPLQIGWGGRTGGGLEKFITDCSVSQAVKTSDPFGTAYSCGTVDWKATQVDNDTIKLKFTNFTRTKGTTNVAAPKFSFGRQSNDRITVNATIKVNGWTWSNSEVRLFGTSTGKVESY